MTKTTGCQNCRRLKAVLSAHRKEYEKLKRLHDTYVSAVQVVDAVRRGFQES